MDRTVIAVIFLLLWKQIDALNLTLCCPDGLGLDEFLLCTVAIEHQKEFVSRIAQEDITWDFLTPNERVYTKYNEHVYIASANSSSEAVLREALKGYNPSECLDFSDGVVQFYPHTEVELSASDFFCHKGEKSTKDSDDGLPIYFCCDKGQILNTATDQCEVSPFNHSLRVAWQKPESVYKEFIGLETVECEVQVKKPICTNTARKYLYANKSHCIKNHTSEHPQFSIDDAGELTMFTHSDVQEIIQKEAYCLAADEAGNTVARVCHNDQCTKGNCLTKCCRGNKNLVIYEDLDFKCESTMNTEVSVLNGQGKSTLGKRLPKAVKNFSLRYGFPACPVGTFLEVIDVEKDRLRGEFWFLSNGSLYLDRFDIGKIFSPYCYDEARNGGTDKSNYRPVAMFCWQSHERNLPTGHHVTQGIAMIVSSFFYALTIMAHVLLPHLWNLQGFTVVSQSLCLMLNFIIMSCIKTGVAGDESDRRICRTLAISAYYFFEASFVWLAVMSCDVYLALRGSSSGRMRRQLKLCMVALYSLIGWGTPAILVTIAVLIDGSGANLPYYVLRPYFAVNSCWFYYDQKILSAYLYGPASIFLIINIMIFVTIARKLYVTTAKSVRLSQADQGRGKARMCAILKLFVLMGISWIFEIISFAAEGNVYIWYFTDFLNILMSVFIFFLFICKKKNLDMFGLQYNCAGRLLRRHFSWEPSSHASHTTSRYTKKAKTADPSNSANTESVVFSKTTSGT